MIIHYIILETNIDIDHYKKNIYIYILEHKNDKD